jgi:c-di-GMP-binding flagellar brake protein YcgR
VAGRAGIDAGEETDSIMRSNNQNKRKYPRAGLVVEADVRYGDVQEGLRVRTKNIGAGGVCLLLPDLVTVGTLVTLTIYLPGDQRSVAVEGEVVWAMQQRKLLKKKSTAFETGIRFTNVEPAERDRMIRFTSEYMS